MGTGHFDKRTPYDAPIRSFGMKRKFKGGMGIPGRDKAHGRKIVCVPRGQTGSTRPTSAGHECGQDRPYATAHIPGKYKVVMPPGRIRVP